MTTPTDRVGDLNRAIAEYLEPSKTLTSLSCADFDLGIIDEKVISAGGSWYFIRDEEPEWKPRDFCGNPAMRDLLQQKLLADRWWIKIVWNINDEFVINAKNYEPRRHFEVRGTYSDIWAIAFAKSVGIWEES